MNADKGNGGYAPAWRLCRNTAVLHVVTAISGVILLGGGKIAELYGLGGSGLQAAGVLLGFVFALALIANAPLAIGALFLCRRDRALVAQSALLVILAVVVWFVKDETLVTFAFFGYAAVVLFTAWKR